MTTYIRSSNTEYFYWIFQDKHAEFALDKGRAASLIECQDMLDYYKKTYGSSCVITVKILGSDRWICTRASNV